MKKLTTKLAAGGYYDHIYHTEEEAKALNLDYVPIREASYVGQWVLLDDGFVTPVCWLLKPEGKPARMCRVGNGMFDIIQKKRPITSEEKENRYSISGKSGFNLWKDKKIDRNDLKILKFVHEYIMTGDAFKAFAHVQKIKGRKRWAGHELKGFMQNKELKAMIRDEVKTVLSKLGVSDEYIVSKYKDIIEDLDEKTSDRIRCLETLTDIAGTKDRETNITTTEGFIGFNKNQLKDGEESFMEIGDKEETKVIGAAHFKETKTS